MIFFILFLIGLCFGSFVNVLIDRIPAGRSVLLGRSICDFCKKELSPFDLIPVFSYIFLHGKCRYCHKKLSLQYPLIEIATGLLFIFVYLIEPSPNSLFYIIDVLLVSLGFALTVMDIKYHILADALLLPFTLLAFLRVLVFTPVSFPISILLGIASSIPLLLIYILTKGKGMGFGDVKLIGILGFLVGFPGILITYYIAFLTGAITGVILILGRKKQFRHASIAFGPFLFLGAGVTILYGTNIWNYIKLFFGL